MLSLPVLRDLGLTEQDELFDEALKAVNTALTSTKLPHDIEVILSDPKAAKLEVRKTMRCINVCFVYSFVVVLFLEIQVLGFMCCIKRICCNEF